MHIANVFEFRFAQLMFVWEIRNDQDEQISLLNTFA